MVRVALSLTWLLMSSCAASFDTYRAAKRLAPHDLRCETISQATTPHDTDFAFEGCGRFVVYNCVRSTGGPAQCFVRERGDGTAWAGARR